jgi:hypothetical protein
MARSVLWTLTLALVLGACGGGGDGGSPAPSASASVAGVWTTPTLTNATAARTANCSDPTLDNVTGQEFLSDCRFGVNAFDLQNPPSGPTVPVSQSGNTFTIQRTNYVCLDRTNGNVVNSAGFMSGAGTVDGNNLELDAVLEDHDFDISGDAVVDTGTILGHETNHFTGAVSGDAVTLELQTIGFVPTAAGTAAGLRTASCGFSPPATYTSTITR